MAGTTSTTTSTAAEGKTSAATAETAEVSTVKYTGSAGVREITTAQWKAAGVEDQKTVVWDADNDYTVNSDQLKPEALELLKRDRNLRIK